MVRMFSRVWSVGSRTGQSRYRLPGRTGQVPAAAHGDDDVGGAYDVVGQRLGVRLGQGDAAFGKELHDVGAELTGGVGSGGAYVDSFGGQVWPGSLGRFRTRPRCHRGGAVTC